MLLRFIFLSLSLSLSLVAPAQQGWWTWLHGVVGTSAPGNYGVQGVAAPTNEPPAFYKTDACWTDSQGRFWFFGGDLGASALWKYDPATNLWTWVKGPNTNGVPGVYGTQGVPAMANNPSPLQLGGLTWVDPQDKLWLFGGNMGTLSDLWKYDPVTNMWTWMKGPGTVNPPGNYGVQGVPAATNLPPPRYESCATWVDNNGNLWMFGGWATAGTLNDLWKYDPVTNMWTWMKGSNTAGNPGAYGVKGVAAPGNNPPSRWSYCRWKDNSGNFWMFGGTHWSNTQSMNDLWKFDPLTNNWTWMSGSNVFDDMPALPAKCTPSVNNYPQARYENHVSWKDKCGNLWMFSGQWAPALGIPNKSDMWCYLIGTNEWVYTGGNVTPSSGVKGVPAGSNFPGDVYGAGAFTVNNEFYIFGGRVAGGGNSNAVWKYVPDSACAKSFCTPQSPDPTANFNASNLIGCAPLTVTFTNTSSNSSQWTWNFGDGNTSNQQHPVHTYTATGTYSVSLIASNGTLSDTLTYFNYVQVVPTAIASYSIIPNDTVCAGTTITVLNTSQNATTWMWNIPNLIKDTTTNLVVTLPAGNYTVNFGAYNAFGCNDGDTFNLVVLTGYSATQSVTICSGNTYTLPGGGVVSSAGTYTDTLGMGGCDSVITTVLTVTPGYSVTITPSICTGDTFFLPWGGFTTSPGTYVDTMQSVAGCDSVITVNLSVSSVLTSTQNVSICAGNTFTLPGGTIVSTAGTYTDTIPSSGGCDSIITTNLSVQANSSSVQNPVICSGNPFVLPGGSTATVTGTYTDTLLSANGCDSIITTNLTVNPTPAAVVSADVTITSGQSITLTASGGGTYSWSPSTGLSNSTSASVIADPMNSTYYCVTVTGAGNCDDTACVMVTVNIVCGTFYLPNAFSPNNDGDNDIFRAYVNPQCVVDYRLSVYNRWGEKVFETYDVKEGWNGEFRGTGSNTAVYAYKCKVEFTNGQVKELQGNVSLVR